MFCYRTPVESLLFHNWQEHRNPIGQFAVVDKGAELSSTEARVHV